MYVQEDNLVSIKMTLDIVEATVNVVKGAKYINSIHILIILLTNYELNRS